MHRDLGAPFGQRGFERTAGGSEEEPYWNVVLADLEERLPVSRRQWPVVKSVLPEPKEG